MDKCAECGKIQRKQTKTQKYKEIIPTLHTVHDSGIMKLYLPIWYVTDTK